MNANGTLMTNSAFATRGVERPRPTLSRKPRKFPALRTPPVGSVRCRLRAVDHVVHRPGVFHAKAAGHPGKVEGSQA